MSEITQQLKEAFREIPQVVYRVSSQDGERIIMASSVTLVDVEEPTILVCIDTKSKNDPLLHSDVLIIDFLEDPKYTVLEEINPRFRFTCTHTDNHTFGEHNVIFLAIDSVEEFQSYTARTIWLGGRALPIEPRDDQWMISAA